MKPRLSVFSALREMFYLWTRNFWIVTVIAIGTGLPQIALMRLQKAYSVSPTLPGQAMPRYFPITVAILFISIAVTFIINTVSIAAILGVLAREATEPDPWPAMRRSIATKTWTLCRLYILISMIACIPGMILGMIVVTLKATSPICASTGATPQP